MMARSKLRAFSSCADRRARVSRPTLTPQAPAIALNLADVTPGPQGGTELLQLAQLDRVWDPVPSRVNLLRQLGVKAFWLQAPAAMPSQTG